MKRVKDGEKMMGAMFPRLHVNDTEKGGPRAPPRNKMALYEQLSIPSQRFACSDNITANLAPLSSQMPPRHPSEMQYSQYSDLTTPLAQVEQRKKSDEDDYIVPIFIHSIPIKNSDTYINNMDREKVSPSDSPFFHHSSKFQMANDAIMLERSITQEGKSNISDLEEEKRYSSNSRKDSPSDRNVVVHDLCNETVEKGNLERGDSVSETSVLDVLSEIDVTPDDVVGVIGQKHFWKARRAIVNQQRVFAVQVFELHRLIKVQKLIAASPHLLLEDSTFFSKPIKPLPAKKLPSDYAVKPAPNVHKRKADFEKPTRKIESTAENTIDKKSSLPSSQNGPSNGYSPAPSFNQPQGHHWLIPVMSPSEGLVYKPYPVPGPNPTMGNFLAPAYGVPAPHPQYNFPSFPPFGAHGCFPPYIMPAFSGSNSGPPHFSAGEADFSIQRYKSTPVPSQNNGPVSEDTASSPYEKRPRSRTSIAVEEKHMLPLFPTVPADGGSDSGPQVTAPEGPARAIKVVARNGVSASEYAARIFRSIQEERKQYDSV